MALNQLSEKLDQLTEQELGIDFDSSEVWSKLEQRLDNRKVYVYWWVVAACVLMAILFLPISLLKETSSTTSTLSQTIDLPEIETPVVVENPKEVVDTKKLEKPIWRLDKKDIEPIQLAQVEIKTPALQLIVFAVEKDNKPTFSGEDISIIQASLGRPKIGKEKNVTVRAQLNTSTQPIQFNNQVLKIKLFEGSNN